MRYFFILAYLPGRDYELKVVMDAYHPIRFDTHKGAVEWCVNELAPDWEWVIVPLRTVEIEDFEDFKVGGTD